MPLVWDCRNAECVWTYLFDSHPSEFITRLTSYFITSDSSKASETILDSLKLKWIFFPKVLRFSTKCVHGAGLFQWLFFLEGPTQVFFKWFVRNHFDIFDSRFPQQPTHKPANRWCPASKWPFSHCYQSVLTITMYSNFLMCCQYHWMVGKALWGHCGEASLWQD